MFGEDRIERIKTDLKSLSEDAEKTALKKMIDPGCQLRSIISFCEAMDKSWSDKLKDHLTRTRAVVVNGQIHAAHMIVSGRNILDQSKLKAALGDDLSDFKSLTPVTSIIFKNRF